VSGQIVHDHEIAGSERGREHLLDIGQKAFAIHWPVQDQGAVIASRRKPAVKVVVFQWPCGTLARQRSPRGLAAAQPRHFVFTRSHR